jgi:cysteinyl-tRNA synthetase
MSKSLGNLYTLDDLKTRGYSPMEVRYTLIGAHYRQPLNFTFHSLDTARSALEKLAKARQALETASQGSPKTNGPGPFQAAWDLLNDDLNVPGALGAVFGHLNRSKPSQLNPDEAAQTLTGLDFILEALGIQLPAADTPPSEIPPDIQALAEQRWQAKQNKDWATSDTLRQQLDAAGWTIKDAKESYQILPKKS